MIHDRDLIDTIKSHFSRKSSAQLEQIAQANDPERWSPEAVAAAGEVLLDRMAGRAEEPEVPEEDLPPPARMDLRSLPFIVGLALVSPGLSWGALAFMRHQSYLRARNPSDADQPVPFGPKTAWLALDTTDTEVVAKALGLREARAATWAEGIDAAHESAVFVTPPLAVWTLAVGTALFPPDRAESFVKPLLEPLSRQFGDSQYFCTHRDVELHIWARARQGRLVRGYGWLGEKSLTLWDEGAPTKEERDLGLRFLDGRSPTGTAPDENCVMQLADLWSIDPTSLDANFKEPAMGLLDKVAWRESRASG